MSEVLFFAVFLLLVAAILLFDLGILSKKSHVVKPKEALGWTLVWLSLALGFYFFLMHYGYLIHGVETTEEIQGLIGRYQHIITYEGSDFEGLLQAYHHTLAQEFLSGFLIEYALSVDNLFVILLIFQSFGVAEKHYKSVLIWGILGAVVMRFSFIFLGAALIQEFHWVLYVFGAFLIFSGLKIFFKKDAEDLTRPEDHFVVKFLSKYFNIFPKNVKSALVFKHDDHKKTYITPLFIVILVVEVSDLIFAVDSIPAIFSITLDPYIVFFSNIFAILGLRSLFFLLAKVVSLFHLLSYGLGLLLVFIGTKLIFEEQFKAMGFTAQISLLAILSILLASILLSLVFPKKDKSIDHSPEKK